MRKNGAGIIVSVTDIMEVGESMVHCTVCGKDFKPSLACDVFPVSDHRDAAGEVLLQCERCMDRALAAEGVRGSVDLSGPGAPRITRFDDEPGGE